MASSEVATPPPPESAVSEPTSGGNAVKDESGSSVRPSSPDPSCPICLDNVTDAAYTDMCCHRFCFHCLVSWSRVKPECPLCKQRFSLIIHNVRSMGDYDELPVLSWAEPPPPSLDANFFISVAFQRPRFRYRTTSGGPWSGWRTQNLFRGPSQDMLPGSSFPPLPIPTTSGPVVPAISLPSLNIPSTSSPNAFDGNTVATEWRRRRQVSACEFRNNVYRQNMWVRPPQRRPGVPYRVRECSPNFYRDNPAQVNRLLPWLHRELLVLLDVRHDYEEVCMRIVHSITTIPIRSPRFQAMMWPYLQERTAHFCHEFYYFATSPYDMLAYDLRAQYVRRDDVAIDPIDQENQDNPDSNSDIEIIEPEPAEVIEISDDDNDDVVRVETVRNDSDASVEIISDSPLWHNPTPEVIDLVEDSGPDRPLSRCQSPVPGPSTDRPERVIDRLRNKFQPYYKDDSTTSEEELPPRRPQRKRKRKSEPVKLRKNIIESYSSDSDTDDTLDRHIKAQNQNSVQTRSKTKYSLSSLSEDKSSKSTSSHTESSGPSGSRCRRKKAYSRRKKKRSKSTEGGSVKSEMEGGSVKSEIPSPPLPHFEMSPTYNFDMGSNSIWAKLFSPAVSDNDDHQHLVIDEDRDSPSPKPRLKSVVRKVGPEEPGSPASTSTWPGHNLRQRKITKHAYAPYFSTVSDSDS